MSRCDEAWFGAAARQTWSPGVQCAAVTQTLHPICDKSIAQAVPQHAADAAVTPKANWVLATCIFASSLAFIDGSVVNVGLAAIGHSLSARSAGLSWVVKGYTLPLCALLLIGGALGDVYGRRRLLMLGVARFSLASVGVCRSTNVGLAGGRPRNTGPRRVHADA